MSTRYYRDSAAVCYSQVSVYHNERGMKLLEKLSPNPDSQILDLGCGTGYLANALAERVGPKGKVLAVDPDGERIKVARESYSSTNLKFLVASDKDFPEGEYDLVLSNFVFHWIENKDAAFRRVYRNLKPGGRFGFTTKDNPTTPDVITQIVHLFGPETVKATLGSFALGVSWRLWVLSLILWVRSGTYGSQGAILHFPKHRLFHRIHLWRVPWKIWSFISSSRWFEKAVSTIIYCCSPRVDSHTDKASVKQQRIRWNIMTMLMPNQLSLVSMYWCLSYSSHVLHLILKCCTWQCNPCSMWFWPGMFTQLLLKYNWTP